MVDLIKRPRQKREQIAHDPGKGDRIAEGRQYPLSIIVKLKDGTEQRIVCSENGKVKLN